MVVYLTALQRSGNHPQHPRILMMSFATRVVFRKFKNLVVYFSMEQLTIEIRI